ncbi:N-acetylglucosaminyl transferase component-domain-containing protein [Phaeosphaeria sp. MPI-PUGE-AT-0046c]|nr:N-acetylglucosaminyl transferase component-domain-containing protein [Phaeosphaeria sp. MPI-PUGE-AT-0046c]
MVTHMGLMRVFWPSDAPRDSLPGVLVGFRNSATDIVVVGILQGVDFRHVEHALVVGTLLRNSPHDVDELLLRCRQPSLHALGVVNSDYSSSHPDLKLLTFHTHPADRLPRIQTSKDNPTTAQVIIYDRPQPRRMQYLSLTPIALALDDKIRQPSWDAAFEKEEMERERKEQLMEKLRLHKVISRPPTREELALPMLIEQVNCSWELNALLQKNLGLLGRRMKRTASVSEQVVGSANNIWDYVCIGLSDALWVWAWPVLSQVLISVLMANRVAAELVLQVLHWRPAASPDAPALKDTSATAQQIDIRLQQFCYWPIQYLTLRKRRVSWGSITNSHPDYIRFYNSLWLVANDIIMGMALGSYIMDNSDLVAARADTIISAWSIDGLRRMIIWLTGWPGGLKLNTELAGFLGDLFLWVIDYWAGCVGLIRPHLPLLIRVIALSAFAGATMPISMFLDLVTVLTLHIYSFYIASARIFHWQLTIMISLFHLFRGKKRNVLRNRIDSCDYDLDQLLLGTILFTLQFFLLPTVFVFYLTFACARVGVIGLKAGLEIGLACLNHFPLFAVMLRLKDPGRLPGGICFELQDTSRKQNDAKSSSTSTASAYVVVKSVPLSLRAMFNPYFELSGRIRKHYLAPSVLLNLASGEFVPPLHRQTLYSLQYSMLPARRATINELWERLNEKNATERKLNAGSSLTGNQAGKDSAAAKSSRQYFAQGEGSLEIDVRHNPTLK